MKRLIPLILIMTGVLLSLSCSKGSNAYWIDNPTEEPITVYIDDKAYDVPAKTKIEINVAYGKHQLKYKDEALTFHNGGRTNNVQAIINPTQSTYVFYKQLFINENDERGTEEYIEWAIRTQSDSIRLKLNDSITTVFVPFRATNDIFIQKSAFDWKYNIDEPMPEGLRLTSPLITRRNRQLANDPNYKAGQFAETIWKLYREDDFKAFFKKFGDGEIDFIVEKIKYADYPKANIQLTKINDISDPEYKKVLADQVQAFNNWLDAKDSKSADGFKDIFFSKTLEERKSEFAKKYPDDFTFSKAVQEYQEQEVVFMKNQLNVVE